MNGGGPDDQITLFGLSQAGYWIVSCNGDRRSGLGLEGIWMLRLAFTLGWLSDPLHVTASPSPLARIKTDDQLHQCGRGR